MVRRKSIMPWTGCYNDNAAVKFALKHKAVKPLDVAAYLL